jgi:SRSO17 transposase
MGMQAEDWQTDLERWLAPFLARLAHPARRTMCQHYLAGLIGPGERKSVQPMSRRLGLGSHDRLHHFIAVGPWDAAPLEEELLAQANRLVGGPNAYLVVDDTVLPKKGSHSVGVAPQYASALGKNANCQTLVSLALAKAEVPVPIGLRLSLPEAWIADPARLDKAGVPQERRTFQTKPELALAEIDRALAAGVTFGCVLADAGYGLSAAFRRGLSGRGLSWAVGIPRHQKVYPVEVGLLFPVAGRGRPRQRHVPDRPSVAAETMLGEAAWRTVSWRRGTRGRLSARFAAMRVRVADGPAQRIGDNGSQHMPGEETWLVGECRKSGERKYYLSNLPHETDLRTLAATIKARWVCEQAHQQLKEELGLDHFEGRSWTGLHRHALMTLIALAFLQDRRLALARRGKKAQRTATPAEPARSAAGHHRAHRRRPTGMLSPLPTTAQPAPT